MTEHSTSTADIDARSGRPLGPRAVAGGLAVALLLPGALLPGLAAAADSSGTGSTAMPELSPAPAPAAPAAKKAPKAKAKATSKATTSTRHAARYKVHSGDSLWTISERLTGPGSSPTKVANALVKLWNANDVRIATGDPDMLPTGIVLKVPAALR